MHLVLSLVALLVLAGQAVAIVRFRSYWPFDHYPMYSFPISRMRYPIVRGEQLTMFSLVEVNADGSTTDLLSGADIYPEAFHPLDRIEVVVLLVRAGMLQGLAPERAVSKQIDERKRVAGGGVPGGSADGAGVLPRGINERGPGPTQLQQALCDLLAFARTNRPQLNTLRLVALEWSFRTPGSDFKHPDRSRVITEVSHS